MECYHCGGQMTEKICYRKLPRLGFYEPRQHGSEWDHSNASGVKVSKSVAVWVKPSQHGQGKLESSDPERIYRAQIQQQGSQTDGARGGQGPAPSCPIQYLLRALTGSEDGPKRE